MITHRAFLAVLVVTAAITLAKGAAEILLPPYLHGYGYSLSLIGAVTAFIAVLQLVSRLPFGAAYRARRAKGQYAAALVVFGLSTSGFALAHGDVVAVIVLSLVHGFAFGSLGTLGLALAIDVSAGRHAGSSMAWYTMAISIGYALGSLVGGSLADAIGKAETLAIVGVLPIIATYGVVTLPRLADVAAPPGPSGLRGVIASGAKLDSRIWLAFVTVLFLNLIQDSVDTFFPVFAPTIGISLATVGVLRALKSGAGTLVRFTAAIVLHAVDYRIVTPIAVIAAAAAAALLPVSSSLIVLAPAMVVIGLTRGLLRATSAATIADLRAEGGEVGVASGVYNSGLDIGGIAGPAVGGVVATAIGIGPMFQVVAIASALIWLAVALSTPASRAAAGLSRSGRATPIDVH
jgi:MFS family permease